VSSVSTGGQSNKRLIAIILAVIGVLFAILGIVYLTVAAGSLPSPLGHINGSTGHHALRMAVSFVIAVVCLVAAWFVNRGSKRGTSNSESSSTSVDSASHG
jgi:L-asparagine transporter-like permease